jgi:hypothetical protein
MGGGRVRFDRALETSAGAIRPAEAMKLLAQHDEQGRVFGGQLLHAIKSLPGQGKGQISGRDHAQLKPKIDDAGKSVRQVLIGGKGEGRTPRAQLVARPLPARHVLRRTFEPGEVSL